MFRHNGFGFDEAALRIVHGVALPPAPEEDIVAAAMERVAEIEQPAGANAHAIKDAMVGKQPPATVSDFFGAIVNLLMEGATPETLAGPGFQSLFNELEGLRVKVADWQDSQRGARLAGLSGQHAELYGKCRASLDKLRLLQQEVGRSSGNLRFAGQRLAEQRAKFRDVENSKPPRGSFPTDSELDTWRRALGAAQEKLAAVEQEHAAAKLAATSAERELQEAAKEFNGLTEQEAVLAAQIAGVRQPFCGLTPA